MSEFRCPKCGGFKFGTGNCLDPSEEWVRECHHCEFTWPIKDDDLYIKDWNPPPTKEEEFEALYLAYWRFVYKYEVGYEDHFKPDEPWYKRNDFKQQLEEEGMTIKITQGY